VRLVHEGLSPVSRRSLRFCGGEPVGRPNEAAISAAASRAGRSRSLRL